MADVAVMAVIVLSVAAILPVGVVAVVFHYGEVPTRLNNVQLSSTINLTSVTSRIRFIAVF